MARFILIMFLFTHVFSQDSALVEESQIILDSGIPDSLQDTLYEELAPLEKEPVLLQFVKAVYPPRLSKKGITGTVILDILVSDSGKVDSVYILNGVDSELDSAVVNAVRKFVFSPAEAGGAAVPVIITYQYNVTLDEVTSRIEEYVNFSGKVLERGTRNPVAYADIAVFFRDSSADTGLEVPFGMYIEKIDKFSGQEFRDGSMVAVTDSTGGFTFRSLPCGPVQVRISAAGYEAFKILDTIVSGKVTEATYRINKTSYSDLEIVVYGKAETREVSRRTLTLNEVRKIPGFGGDAVKVVQALPGVGRSSFGGGSIRVRGAPSWDSKFYLDGIPIPQLYHFGGVKSTYNSDALSSVDLYPGGFSSRFGNSIAGVIELTGRNADRERVKGFADVNLFDATLFAEGPVGPRGGVIATARRSYIGDLVGYAIKKANLDIPITVLPYYYDYIVRADVDITPVQKIFITLFGSKDELLLIVPFMRGGSKEVDALVDRVRQMNVFNMVLVGWDSYLFRGWENRLRAAVIQGEGLGSIFGFAKWEFDNREYLLREELSYKFSDKYRIKAGADMWLQNYRQESIFPNPDRTFLKDTMQVTFGLAGPYLQFEYTPTPALQIISGLRYDYYPELIYDGSVVPEFWNYDKFNNERGFSGEPSLRLSARYELTEKHTIKTALGSYNQTPQPTGLSTHDTLGNPLLPATKARHIVGGYEWRITDLLSADIQLYHNSQWDIPEMANGADLIADPSGPRFFSEGKGRMYGMELLIRHEQSERLFGWIAYTLSRSERYSRGEHRFMLYERDQTHNLQFILNYRLPREWEAGTRIRYVTGNPYTPVVDRVFNVTQRFYNPIMGEENSERNGSFFMVDFRIDKKFVFDKWMMAMYFDLQNVLSFVYKSPEFTMYNYDFTDKVSVTSPFIPSLGIRAEF